MAVEIRIDAVPGETPPPDTFVAMRVGDVQKQTRFENTRTYRFEDPKDERGCFGRIEVFKRIGTMTVPLDTYKNGVDKDGPVIEVPVSYPDLNNRLRMRMTVKDFEAKVPTATHKRTKAKKRLDEAQQYLQDFNLEEVLAEAMREVIRSRPGNPYEFLSQQILNNSGPPPPVKPKDLTLKPADTAKSVSLAPPPAPIKEMPPLSPSERAEAAIQPKSEMDVLRENAFNTLTEAAKKGDLQRVFQEKAVTLTQAAAVAQKPAADSIPVTTPAPAAAPVATPAPAAAPVAAPAAEPVATPAPVAAPVAKPSSGFHLKPSVGTWCARKSFAKEPAAKLYKPFHQLPSVGTWLTPTFVEEPEPSSGPSLTFNRLPSVGTWLAPAPIEKDASSASAPFARAAPAASASSATKAFRHRPSVGTWLVTEPPQVERPWYYQLPADPSAHTEHCKALQKMIGERDSELDRLKAQIAALQAGQSAPSSPTAAALAVS